MDNWTCEAWALLIFMDLLVTTKNEFKESLISQEKNVAFSSSFPSADSVARSCRLNMRV